MSNRAWVTLATNDSYGLGALVLTHSLRRAGSSYPAVVLITPSVTEAMRDRLRAVFAEVIIVDVLDSKDAAHLALLQRPELGITFTKIHCWNLTQYEKCVFLDADTLIVQNCDELFEREELSAAPDVGWPDCFNSGVFVFKPSAETFDSLIKFAQERGSFDGGDQGLLNSYFSDWAHGDMNKHLPFLYNVTSAAFYSYLPALKHYGQNLKIIHFIGATKPWLQQFNWETRTSEAPQHLRDFLQLWWNIYVAHVHSVLDISMVEIEEALPATSPQETFFHTEPRLDYCHYEPVLDPESEFPWHHPDAQIPEAELNVPEIDVTQFHDPWDIYRGHIPPKIEDSLSHHIESQKPGDHDEMRKYAWDYVSPQPYHADNYCPDVQNIWEADNSHQTHVEHVDQTHRGINENVWEYNPQHNYNQEKQYSQTIYQEIPHDTDRQSHTHVHNIYTYIEHQHNQENLKHQNHYYLDHSQQDKHYPHKQPNLSQQQTGKMHEFSFQNESEKNYHSIQQSRVEQVYYVHLDHEKVRDRESNKTEIDDTEAQCLVNGYGEVDNEIFENLRPRHPYDGFYLRHRMTIDSRGRKICTHEVPPTPTPSPPESPAPEEIYLEALEEEIEQEENKQSDVEDQTGVAGNFARMVLGAGAQREALDDLTRRQGWEAGNIDYMGADAFDNIWAKISQTLNQPRSSPPKQPSPPPAEVPAPIQQVVESPAAPAPIETPVPIPAPVEAPITAAPISIPAEEPLPAEAKAPACQIAAAVDEPAKIVAAAPTEPMPAAKAPVVAPIPVSAPAAPVKPATIPPAASETKSDAVPVPKIPPPADIPVAAAAVPSKPAAPKTEATPVKGASTTDSPPLANTPSKEDLPVVPAAKSEERRKPAGLQLPTAIADALPTPDSELEDAATLANAIIAGELRTRTPAAASPAPPALPADPAPPTSPLPQPAVSLSQIGVEPQPKPKSTIAAQIESSVTEAADPPKKKVVKKVLKKDSGDAPVPPPRKKEKKPKDK